MHAARLKSSNRSNVETNKRRGAFPKASTRAVETSSSSVARKLRLRNNAFSEAPLVWKNFLSTFLTSLCILATNFLSWPYDPSRTSAIAVSTKCYILEHRTLFGEQHLSKLLQFVFCCSCTRHARAQHLKATKDPLHLLRSILTSLLVRFLIICPRRNTS